MAETLERAEPTSIPAPPIPRDRAKHLSKWTKGQSGNPAGRPKGSRVRFAETFLKDLQDAWERHGIKALDDTAKNEPSVFVRVAAAVLPKEVNATLHTELDGMSADQLRAFIQAELEASQPKTIEHIPDTLTDQRIDID